MLPTLLTSVSSVQKPSILRLVCNVVDCELAVRGLTFSGILALFKSDTSLICMETLCELKPYYLW